MPTFVQDMRGSRWEDDPWDNVEARQAAAKDAATTHLNQMMMQGRGLSDARGINRDNLNFNVWSTQQAGARNDAALSMQARLAAMQEADAMTRFNTSNMLQDQRAERTRGWSKEDRQEQRDYDAPYRELDLKALRGRASTDDLLRELTALKLQAGKTQLTAENTAQEAGFKQPNRFAPSSPDETVMIRGMTGPEADRTLMQYRQSQLSGAEAEAVQSLRRLASTENKAHRFILNPRRWAQTGDQEYDPEYQDKTAEYETMARQRLVALEKQYRDAGMSPQKAHAKARDAVQASLAGPGKSLDTESMGPVLKSLLEQYGI